MSIERFAAALLCLVAVILAGPSGTRAQQEEDPPRSVHLLPDGLLYPSYAAGEKEPRLAAAFLFDTSGGSRLDAALGGRLGVLRLGTGDGPEAEGWQLDVEGAALTRLNLDNIRRSFESVDFRFGFPLTTRRGRLALKLGYYHLSSHVGDEFLQRRPGFQRINYVRDAIVSGLAYRVAPEVLAYGEAAYAFYAGGGAEPWELQFGLEYRPTIDCSCGAPFVAANGHLREEVDFGGTVNLLAGWELRSPRADRLLRVALQYLRGKSSQYQFFDEDEELIGVVVQFDY